MTGVKQYDETIVIFYWVYIIYAYIYERTVLPTGIPSCNLGLKTRM